MANRKTAGGAGRGRSDAGPGSKTALAAVLAVALGLRLAHAWTVAADPFFDHLPFGNPGAGGWAAAGRILLAVAGCWALYRAGRVLGGEVLGLCAAGLAATYPAFLFYDVQELPASPAASLASSLLWALAVAWRRGRGARPSAAAAGLALVLLPVAVHEPPAAADLPPAIFEDAGALEIGGPPVPVSQEPAGAGGTLLGGVRRFWSWYEEPGAVDYYYVEGRSPVLRWMPLDFGGLALLALAGLWTLRRRPGAFMPVLAVLAGMTVATAALQPLSQDRLPAVPALILLAALPLEAAWTAFCERRQSRAALLSPLIAAALAIPRLAPFEPRLDLVHLGLARIAAERGEDHRATAHYRAALRHRPRD